MRRAGEWESIRGLEAELGALFTDKTPLGPIEARSLDDRRLFKFLFDDGNALVGALKQSPSLVVGRRGAGKTAILEQVRLNPGPAVSVLLEAPNSFVRIVHAIEKLSSGFVFVEHVAKLWQALFWVAIMRQVTDQRMAPAQLERTLQAFLGCLGPPLGVTPYESMAGLVDRLSAGGGNLSEVDSALRTSLAPGDGVPTFLEVQAQLTQFLRARGEGALVLMDSLEDFPLDQTQMGHAIGGLLKAVSSLDDASGAKVICCLPAELYHEFMGLSSNPNKDFSRQLLLHWHAGELVRLAAFRLSTWLRLRAPKFFGAEIERLDLSRREGVANFWSRILPARVRNAVGRDERVLPYMLRHTQLLPRQLLMYLNQIVGASVASAGAVFPVSEESVRKGVEDQEPVAAAEVFNGYKRVFPGLKEACARCVPHLGNTFSFGDLHRVFNRHGKWVDGSGEFERFLEMLKTAGVIGRVLGLSGADPESYCEGVFEYTEAHRLVVSSEDRLCLHPIFTKQFSARRSGGQPSVYPYGSDAESS